MKHQILTGQTILCNLALNSFVIGLQLISTTVTERRSQRLYL
ncbi:hypothetical protein ACVWYG_003269 [Pedobacter sp. UYEF25]